jgi:hypothetical protein
MRIKLNFKEVFLNVSCLDVRDPWTIARIIPAIKPSVPTLD